MTPLTEIWETCCTDQRHETGSEAYTYWRERGHYEWNGRLAKPQRPETNILFNTPDIQKTDL